MLGALAGEEQREAHGARHTRRIQQAAASVSAAPPGDRRRATKSSAMARASCEPIGPCDASSIEKAARSALCVAQAGEPAAVREVAVVQHGHDVEQGVEPGLLRRQAAGDRAP